MTLREAPTLHDGGLTVIFTNYNPQAFLFKTAIQWVLPKRKKVHWVREAPYEMIPPIDPSLLADVACLKKITFYYEGLKCFEKAVTLSALKTVRSVYSAIIVDVSSRSVPHRLALCTCLALLHEFGCGGRKAVVVLPKDEDWMMLASLYTDHLFELKEDGCLTNLVNHELLLSK